MSAVHRAAPENPLRSAANPVVAPALSQSRRPEHVPAPGQFVPDTAPPAFQTVPLPPAVHDSAALLHRYPRESSSSRPPHAQSEPQWRSKPVQKWSDVLPANSACICLLYTSDAADEEDSVDLGGRRI